MYELQNKVADCDRRKPGAWQRNRQGLGPDRVRTSCWLPGPPNNLRRLQQS